VATTRRPDVWSTSRFSSLKFVAALLIAAFCLSGCAGDAGKATEEDQANLDRLVKEGIGPSNPPPDGGVAPKGEVEDP